MKLILTRLDNHKDGVFGEITLDGKVICKTVEKRWHNNQRQISCIPQGTYHCTKRISQKYGHHWHLQDVPDRDLILIHSANWAHELLGCIGVGKSIAIGADKKTGINAKMVTSSVATMQMLRAMLPDSFDLEITGVV
jgi:hypothetical protein